MRGAGHCGRLRCPRSSGIIRGNDIFPGKGTSLAKEVIERLIDDLDGSQATETIRFAIDGKAYEIDLNEKNAQTFRKAFERYTEAGRSMYGAASLTAPRRGRSRATDTRAKPERDYDIQALRVWADENDITVPKRGRIPGDVVERYKAATGS
jgi:hypothetical protein